MESAIIFAAVNGYFDTFAPEATAEAETKLQDYLSREAASVLETIRTSKEIGEETEKSLREALQNFVDRQAA